MTFRQKLSANDLVFVAAIGLLGVWKSLAARQVGCNLPTHPVGKLRVLVIAVETNEESLERQRLRHADRYCWAKWTARSVRLRKTVGDSKTRLHALLPMSLNRASSRLSMTSGERKRCTTRPSRDVPPDFNEMEPLFHHFTRRPGLSAGKVQSDCDVAQVRRCPMRDPSSLYHDRGSRLRTACRWVCLVSRSARTTAMESGRRPCVGIARRVRTPLNTLQIKHPDAAGADHRAVRRRARGQSCRCSKDATRL